VALKFATAPGTEPEAGPAAGQAGPGKIGQTWTQAETTRTLSARKLPGLTGRLYYEVPWTQSPYILGLFSENRCKGVTRTLAAPRRRRRSGCASGPGDDTLGLGGPWPAGKHESRSCLSGGIRVGSSAAALRPLRRLPPPRPAAAAGPGLAAATPGPAAAAGRGPEATVTASGLQPLGSDWCRVPRQQQYGPSCHDPWPRARGPRRRRSGPAAAGRRPPAPVTVMVMVRCHSHGQLFFS
jgi:hypothetical protein